MVDLHAHAAPSLLPRHGNERADRRRRERPSGSPPWCSSRTRAPPWSGPRAVGRDGVYGGIVLNGPVGGANPDAVEVAARLGGRVVWMPTVSSATHKAGASQPRAERAPGLRAAAGRGVRRRPAAARLATTCWTSSPRTTWCWPAATSSADETVGLFREAARRGVHRLLVNHPKMPFLGWHDDAATELRAARRAPGAGHPARPARTGRPDQPGTARRLPARAARVRRRPRARRTTRPPTRPSRTGCAAWRRRIGADTAHSDPDHQRTKAAPAMTTIALAARRRHRRRDPRRPRRFPAPAGRRRRADHPHRPAAATAAPAGCRPAPCCPNATIEACREADVILSGAVGTHPGVTAEQCPHPESALITLRHMFDLRISVRTVWAIDTGDVTIVRNITDGAYVEAAPPHRERRHQRRDRPDPAAARTGPRGARAGRRLRPGGTRPPLPQRRQAQRVRHLPALAHTRQGGLRRPRRRLRTRQRRPRRLRAGQVRPAARGDRHRGHLRRHPVRHRLRPGRLTRPVRVGDHQPRQEVRLRRHRPVRARARLRPRTAPAPGRSNPTGAWLALAALLDWCPDLQHHSGSGRTCAARSPTCTPPASAPTTWPAPASAAVALDEFNEQILASLETHRG